MKVNEPIRAWVTYHDDNKHYLHVVRNPQLGTAVLDDSNKVAEIYENTAGQWIYKVYAGGFGCRRTIEEARESAELTALEKRSKS
jgi:hypothetical protein